MFTTLGIIVCAVLIYIENIEHWSLLMKLIEIVG
jgi:hypothetical protein